MPNSGKLNVAWLYDDSLDTNDGVAQYVKTLGAWMSGRGHKVTYLVGETKLETWNESPVHALAKNIKVRWGGNRLTIPLKSKPELIKNILAQNNFDVVHVTAPYSPVMSKRVIMALPKSTALVGTWHIYPARKAAIVGSKALKLSYGRSLKRFDEFVAVSSAARKYAASAFNVDSTVVPNAVVVTVQASNKPKAGRIVFLGRLVKRKGPDYLIKAFAKLSQTMPETELYIAGDGPMRRKLEALAKRLGVDKSVKFLGYIDETQKFKLLSSAQLACFPSLYGESFGLVLIEAMAAGAGMVVGGDNPGYRSVLGARAELLVQPRKTNEFAGCLEKLLRDKKLAVDLNRWQHEQLKQYDVEVVGPKIIKLYERAIAKRQSSRHNYING